MPEVFVSVFKIKAFDRASEKPIQRVRRPLPIARPGQISQAK